MSPPRTGTSASPRSAGVLLYRRGPAGLEVFLAHPGGPFWARKDDGHWTIPKGEVEPGEDPLTAARRELGEETGIVLPDDAPALALGEIRQKGGKVVVAWAVEHPADPPPLASNTVRVEWPPRSGRTIDVPEVDRAQFFGVAEARRKIKDRQSAFLDTLEQALSQVATLE